MDMPADLVVIASDYGSRRGPAVAVILAGMLQRDVLVEFIDVFDFDYGSLDGKAPAWTQEGNRLTEFLQSGRPVWL